MHKLFITGAAALGLLVGCGAMSAESQFTWPSAAPGVPSLEEQNRIADEAFRNARPQPCIGLARECFTEEDYAEDYVDW